MLKYLKLCSRLVILSVEGEDFMLPSPPEATFSSGDSVGSTACVGFYIIDDSNLEFDHEFTVILSSVNPTGPLLSAMSSSTTVSITDNEGMHMCH